VFSLGFESVRAHMWQSGPKTGMFLLYMGPLLKCHCSQLCCPLTARIGVIQAVCSPKKLEYLSRYKATPNHLNQPGTLSENSLVVMNNMFPEIQ
jgi:hypothetical protein